MTTLKIYGSYEEIKNKIYIPKAQREPIPEHVKTLRSHINMRFIENKEPIFGALDFAELDDILYVVDGQHRLKAIEEEFKQNNRKVKIYAIVYKVTRMQEIKDMFIIRNKGIPIPEFLVTETSEVKTDLLKEIYSEILGKPGFDLNKKNRPYVNIPNFIDCLSKSDMLGIIITVDDFKIILKKINEDCIQNSLNKKYLSKYSISEPMLKKFREWGNYIGIDKNFPFFEKKYPLEPYDALLRNRNSTLEINNLNLEEKENKESSSRKKFSQTERNQIWNSVFGLDRRRIKCPHCKDHEICITNYDIGHVISLHNGGSNDFSNLRPICGNCNNVMGSKNMNLDHYSIEGL